MHTSAIAESVSRFSTGRSSVLLLSRFRIGIAKRGVSIMEFMVPAQVVDLSDLNVIPLFCN